MATTPKVLVHIADLAAVASALGPVVRAAYNAEREMEKLNAVLRASNLSAEGLLRMARRMEVLVAGECAKWYVRGALGYDGTGLSEDELRAWTRGLAKDGRIAESVAMIRGWVECPVGATA